MHDPVSKQHMLDIAANYDALAERVESLRNNCVLMFSYRRRQAGRSPSTFSC